MRFTFVTIFCFSLIVSSSWSQSVQIQASNGRGSASGSMSLSGSSGQLIDNLLHPLRPFLGEAGHRALHSAIEGIPRSVLSRISNLGQLFGSLMTFNPSSIPMLFNGFFPGASSMFSSILPSLGGVGLNALTSMANSNLGSALTQGGLSSLLRQNFPASLRENLGASNLPSNQGLNAFNPANIASNLFGQGMSNFAGVASSLANGQPLSALLTMAGGAADSVGRLGNLASNGLNVASQTASGMTNRLPGSLGQLSNTFSSMIPSVPMSTSTGGSVSIGDGSLGRSASSPSDLSSSNLSRQPVGSNYDSSAGYPSPPSSSSQSSRSSSPIPSPTSSLSTPSDASTSSLGPSLAQALRGFGFDLNSLYLGDGAGGQSPRSPSPSTTTSLSYPSVSSPSTMGGTSSWTSQSSQSPSANLGPSSAPTSSSSSSFSTSSSSSSGSLDPSLAQALRGFGIDLSNFNIGGGASGQSSPSSPSANLPSIPNAGQSTMSGTSSGSSQPSRLPSANLGPSSASRPGSSTPSASSSSSSSGSIDPSLAQTLRGFGIDLSNFNIGGGASGQSSPSSSGVSASIGSSGRPQASASFNGFIGQPSGQASASTGSSGMTGGLSLSLSGSGSNSGPNSGQGSGNGREGGRGGGRRRGSMFSSPLTNLLTNNPLTSFLSG